MTVMTVTQRRGQVRALTDRDIPQIAELYERVFWAGEPSGFEARRAYLTNIFCDHPWRDDRLPSLVYEDEAGALIGCLGVMPRPMALNGRRIQAAVSHTLMVDPNHRSSQAAFELIKTFFAGPQDLSMAEGNAISQRLWRVIGGIRAPLHSLSWTRPLRPVSHAVSFLRRRGLPAAVGTAVAPVGRLADAVIARFAQNPLRCRVPETLGGELDADTLLGCLSELSRTRSFWPEYSEESLNWLFDVLRRKTDLGMLRKTLVRRPRGEVLGAYVYYANPGGVSEVVQAVARPEATLDVLDHLSWDARQQGAIAVSGRVDPGFLQALSDRYCRFRLDSDSAGVWVRSNSPALLQTILSGDGLLTRLECEWWISFQG